MQTASNWSPDSKSLPPLETVSHSSPLFFGRSGLRPSLVRGDTPRNAPLQNPPRRQSAVAVAMRLRQPHTQRISLNRCSREGQTKKCVLRGPKGVKVFSATLRGQNKINTSKPNAFKNVLLNISRNGRISYNYNQMSIPFETDSLRAAQINRAVGAPSP